MTLKRFHKQTDGEWVQPRMKGYLMACCDCGLVHRMNFRVAKSVVQFQAFRAPKYTAKRRKGLKP